MERNSDSHFDKADFDQTISFFRQNNGLDLSRNFDLNGHVSLIALAASIKSIELLNILESKFKVNYQTECNSSTYFCDGYNALGVSLSEGWIEGFDYFVKKGANPNFLYNNYRRDGLTSLLYATTKQDLALVKYLLSVGANLNSPGVVVTALLAQNDDLLEIFLNAENLNANIAGTDELMKRTTYPIIEAARLGRTDYVKALLLAPGVKKDITDSLGYRAIDWAATNGYQEIVKLLK